MVVLALDTSTRAGSIAVWERDCLRAVRTGDAGRLHAVRLPGALHDVLRGAGLDWPDVTRLAVVTGPGGFTGLRVGLATIKGLAVGLGVGVVARSSLELLARAGAEAVPGCDLTGAWMQGMRGEVFTALYRGEHDDAASTPVLAPLSDTPEPAADAWVSVADGSRVAVAGDALDASGDGLRARLPGVDLTFVQAPPLAGLLARIAVSPGAELLAPHAVLPTYVRRPDAVMARLQAGDTLPDLP